MKDDDRAERADAAVRPGPLAGVRVLDMTTVLMGPSATQVLGDLGADVIKVESPGGDSMRAIGPFRNPRMGPLFLQANRNKRSIVLDLKQADDRRTLVELAGTVDVLVSNVRPQAMRRLALDPASLSETNPGLIYCTAVGYGSGGPNAGQAVYDDLMQAAAGIAGLFEQVDGEPRYAPVNLCDRVVGLYLVIAVQAALRHRDRTGEGQAVEVPMFETMAQFVLADHMGGGAFVPPLGEMGYRRLKSRQRGPYPTRDGHLSIVVYTDAHWRAFSRLIGREDLVATDPRFANQEARTQNAEFVGAFLAAQLPSRTTADWLRVLAEVDIPASPVNHVEDLFDDPHLRATGLFEDREHPTEGTLKVARFPVRFSASPASIRRLAPNLGEHGDEIRAELSRLRAHAQPGGSTGGCKGA